MINMTTDNFIKDVFAVVDSKNGKALADMITEDGIFRFANIPVVQGRQSITDFLDNFFKSIKDISHDQLEDWKIGDTRFATGRVTYTRHDGSTLSVPFCPSQP